MDRIEHRTIGARAGSRFFFALVIAAASEPAGCGGTDRSAPIEDAIAPQLESACRAGAAYAPGTRCNPIVMASFPFSDRRDTRQAPGHESDAYFCEPDTDESGGEIVYELEVSARSRLTAQVIHGQGTDVDLHLQARAGTPSSCLTRGDRAIDWVLEPGSYLIVVDTFAGRTGEPEAGPFELRTQLTPLMSGPCAVESIDLEMYWASCAPGIDGCDQRVDARKTRTFLRTPTVGPVVKEAHLVTTADAIETTFPLAGTEAIDRHYALSQASTGFAMRREEPWAPSGEGKSSFGQGSTGVPIPVDAEAWYVTMYWRDRPARGTRMIIVNPANGRAVVAAAGYETGPGSNASVAGVSEEIHHHLGTEHRDALFVGFAVDQGLPFGPIDCGVDER